MIKDWYKSKTIWGGLLVCSGGVFTALGHYLTGTLDLQTMFTTVIPLIGNGLGLIGIRVAMLDKVE
jgi:hypothetical protein